MQPIIAQPRRLRFAVAVILAVCLASALAQDIEAPDNRPIFVKPPEKAYFHETFQGDLRRWVRSKDEKFKDGDWAVGNGAKGSAIKGEQGLIVRGAAKHHAISVLLPDITTEKGLIVQYEVKLHTPLNCGGAYIKLLRSDPAFTQETMTNASPYVIMFGPDRCGTHDKVHFIFNHKNPLNGSYSEKHLKYPPNLRNDRVTHLYSLAIFPDNKFEIKIDQALVSRGSLLDDMTPPVNPPAEIDDPNDKPPADWVLEKRIPDPTHVKPADWDESQPAMVEDPDAVKPEGWLDDVEPEIQTDLKPPFDYDPVKDGPWLPPRMSNPACLNAPGCGPWTRPKIPNPKFKGKWMPRLIDNPAYKGEYKPRKIPNPDYFKDTEPYKMDPMGALGIELWTMQDDIEFDNFYIGYDVEDAYAFAERTWRPKYTKEKEEEEKGKPKRASTTPSAGVFSDPIQFFKDYPAAAVIAALFGAVILLFFCARLLVRKPEQGGEPDDEEEHSHSHSHSHSHDHGDHSHSHDHGHSHGSEPQATPVTNVEAPERKEEAPPGEDAGLKQRKKGKPRKDQ